MKTDENREWPLCYYLEQNPDERRQLLLHHMQEEPDNEADRIRLKLWEVRYAKRPKNPPQVDYFVKGMLSLITESKVTVNFLNQRQERKNMDLLMKDLCIRDSSFFDRNEYQNQALVNELLDMEYQALASFYYSFSLHDHKYGSALMGTLSMKEEKVIEKLAGDVKRACVITPTTFHLEEEFQLFKSACYTAFCDDFPKQVDFLTK